MKFARLDANATLSADDFTLASAQETVVMGEELPDMLIADAFTM